MRHICIETHVILSKMSKFNTFKWVWHSLAATHASAHFFALLFFLITFVSALGIGSTDLAPFIWMCGSDLQTYTHRHIHTQRYRCMDKHVDTNIKIPEYPYMHICKLIRTHRVYCITYLWFVIINYAYEYLFCYTVLVHCCQFLSISFSSPISTSSPSLTSPFYTFYHSFILTSVRLWPEYHSSIKR